MRGLKEFFCKIVAAVICFGMKVFSGSIFENILKEKNASIYPKIEENRIYGNNKGQTGSVCTEMTSSVADELSYIGNSINKSQYHLFLKRVFYWLQGPGDRLYNSKSSSENKDLERKKKMLFHLVPE